MTQEEIEQKIEEAMKPSLFRRVNPLSENATKKYGGPFGSQEWKPATRLPDDVITERYSRMADVLNNRFFAEPSELAVTTTGLQGDKSQGFSKLPEVKTEDQKLQEVRRKVEERLRDWNMELTHTQKEYLRDMGLLEDYMKHYNSVYNALMEAFLLEGQSGFSRDLIEKALGRTGGTRNMIESLAPEILFRLLLSGMKP